jgi:flagellar hook protein FlgE
MPSSMSLFDAINAAVSGLSGQSDALNSIANNIANSSAVGYKEGETEFADMVLSGGATSSADLAGTQTRDRVEVSQAGQITATGVATDIAINGGGFMVVNTTADPSSGQYLLTRAGSFRPDANGNLVNSAGYYLQGVPLGANGQPLTAGGGSSLATLSTVNVANISGASSPTSSMTFTANLPAGDTGYSATPPAPSQSSVTYYDPLGNAQSLTFTFTPVQPTSAGNPATNTWTMQIYDSASTAPNTPVGQATLAFNSSGANAGELASVTPTTGTYSPTAGTFTVTTASGVQLPIQIGALNSASGMTQFAGNYTPTTMQANGSAFGQLTDVNVNAQGQVVASFSNGMTRPIYQLELGVVDNPDGLTAVSGDAFALSPEAGSPSLYTPGQGPAGTTEGGSLEGSNVDLATQLTNMIATQRAYDSNATVVQTGAQMLQALTQVVTTA